MGKGNPNPTPRFQKGDKKPEGSGRKAGQINQITRDIKTIIRRAAEEVGFIRRVPVLDAEGKPTDQMETRYGEGGELGYMKWLAENYPGHYAALYGRLIPFDVNAKVEEKTVVVRRPFWRGLPALALTFSPALAAVASLRCSPSGSLPSASIYIRSQCSSSAAARAPRATTQPSRCREG